MIPITTSVHETLIINALHQQGRDHVLAFMRLLARYADDPSFMADLAELFAKEAADAKEFNPPGRRPGRHQRR